MKRRWQSSRGNGGIGSVWNSIDKPGICSGHDNYADEGLKGFFLLTRAKMPVTIEIQMTVGIGNGCKESNGLSFDNGGCSDQKIGEAAYNVRVWLEEHGFSKCASLLQMRKRCLCSPWKTSRRWVQMHLALKGRFPQRLSFLKE